VHLVINQVVELQHVHVTHGYRAFEWIAGASIDQFGLTTLGHVCQFKQLFDLFFCRTVKNRCRHWNTRFKVTGHGQNFFIGELGHVDPTCTITVVDFAEKIANLLDGRLAFHHLADTQAQTLRGPAKMRFQHLPDIHTGGYAQWIQNDIYRCTIFRIGHVFHRNDHGNYTLVTVTACHLVTRLDTTLDGHVNLDHLEHAGRQVIS